MGIMKPEEILHQAFINWIETSNVSALVKDKERFIVYLGSKEIEVNFTQFPDAYFNKHISNDMNGYSVKFLKAIEKTMFSALAKIEVKDYEFRFTFKYWGKVTSKTVKYYLLSKVA
jgi:hypothetical protein